MLSLDRGLFQGDEVPEVTHAILNPPYRKIATRSRERILLNSLGMETSNLYAAFVWLAFRRLAEGGELAAITPRSFCNGPYFRQFNGHTQVNASDLRAFRYPDAAALEKLGKAALDDGDQAAIDLAMSGILGAPTFTA